MLKTSLLLSVLSAILSFEVPSKALQRTTQNKVQETSSAVAIGLTDSQRIEAEARQNVGQSLVDE